MSLEGGGARGSYQAGAAKAFKEKDIGFKGVVGTSIGSFNGAFVAMDQVDQLVDIWENISVEKVFKVSDREYEELVKIDFNPEALQSKFRKVSDIVKGGGIDVSMAQQMLEEYIDEDVIRSRGIDFGLVTVAFSELRPIEIFIDEIPQGKVKEYILASSALPYFKLEKIEGIKYLDGGFYNVLPTDMLIKKGYTDVWEVRLHGFGRKKKYEADPEKVRIRSVSPTEPLGGILDFSNELARHQLTMGYYDTIRMIDQLSGKIYCIKPVNDEGYFIDILKRLPDSIIFELADTLDLEERSGLRTLFERIIPRIAELLDLEDGASYEEIVTSFLEVQATELQIDRFAVYSFEELFALVKKKSSQFKDGKGRKNQVIDFLLKNELLSKVAKESSIRHLAKTVIREAAKIYEERD